jgi:hypothetical protein
MTLPILKMAAATWCSGACIPGMAGVSDLSRCAAKRHTLAGTMRGPRESVLTGSIRTDGLRIIDFPEAVALHEGAIFLGRLFRVHGIRLAQMPAITSNPLVDSYEFRGAIVECT